MELSEGFLCAYSLKTKQQQQKKKNIVHYDKEGLMLDLESTGHMAFAVRKQKVMNA